ncbi:MAG: response regulator [Leptospiraceae bacterium]|nr:response regulator [Leptospiraceae bacterium]MCP5492948.1 response regulator [Leptospiraceae bacterium]
MLGSTILVVDDSKITRMKLIKNLGDKFSEWRFLEAQNGKEALTVLEKEAANLILIDYNMPEMDGISLAKKIMELYPNVCLQLVTGNIQNATKKEAEKLNMLFIEKPITDETVQKIIHGYEKYLEKNS